MGVRVDLVTSARLACPSCEVLTTGESECFVCGAPMVVATSFPNPTSASYRNTVLALINQETP
jgi:hypothetical protein